MSLAVGTVVRDPWTETTWTVSHRLRALHGQRCYSLWRPETPRRIYESFPASEVESWEVVKEDRDA